MEGVAQCPAPHKRGSPPPPLPTTPTLADRLSEALTNQVFKETKTAKKNDLPNGERRRIEKDGADGHLESMETCNLLTIWLDGRRQPSSVFLELRNPPNYSVRKIQESQRAVEWKRGAKSSPLKDLQTFLLLLGGQSRPYVKRSSPL